MNCPYKCHKFGVFWVGVPPRARPQSDALRAARRPFLFKTIARWVSADRGGSQTAPNLGASLRIALPPRIFVPCHLTTVGFLTGAGENSMCARSVAPRCYGLLLVRNTHRRPPSE